MAFSEEEVPPAPRTPTTYRDHIESHDLKSTGRRLFPKRRLTLSQFATVNPRNSPDFGPTNFLVTPASDLHAHEAQGRYTSASSINTVKRHISPAKSWDSPYTDAGSGDFCRDQTPCKSVSLPLVQRAKRNTSLSLGNSCPSSSVSCAIDGILCPRETSNTMMEAAFTAPLYSKAPARRYLEWKSVREFHKNRVAGVFGSSRTWPRRGILPPGIPEGLDQTYQNATIQRIVTWDCSVEICTAARISALGTVQVYHHAVISVTVPNQEVYAKRTRFSMIMMNGLRDNQTCRLAPGQSSLIFREEISTSQASYEDEAEITIERESCDLEKPIHLYLLFNYPSHRYYVIASLPTFRPQEGRVLYENVIIAKYIPPLQITPLARSGLSSWKFRDDPVNRSTFIERSEDPRFYTERLRDDIQVKIMELSRVHFPLLAGCYLSDVAWKLDIVVQKVLGAKLQCRMSFFLVVGEADAVVSIVPYGWIPTFFVVNGRLANEKEGEWRQTEDGRLILFRQPHMCPGPIRVETCWHEPLTHDIDNGSKPSDLFLPVVADRKVLGGVLICKLNNTKMILSSPGMEDRLDELTDRTDALLPTLQKGYSIHLHRVYCPSICGSNRGSDVLHPKRAVDLEGMSPSKAIIKPSLTSFGTNHIDSSNHTSHHLEQVSGPNQQKYRGLFVPLLVVFVLLPGILLSSSNTVGKVSLDKRVELNNHCQYNAINAVQSGEENLDSIGVPPTGAAVMLGETRGSPVERGLEGWRDWIDVKLGWRGHAT